MITTVVIPIQNDRSIFWVKGGEEENWHLPSACHKFLLSLRLSGIQTFLLTISSADNANKA